MIYFYSALLFLFSFSLHGLPCADAETLLLQMSLEEKIGQLFVAPVYPDQVSADYEQKWNDHTVAEDHLVRNDKVGGVLLKYRWTPLFQRHRVDRLQQLSCVPLFVAQDLEWGLGSRIDFTIRYPKNMTVGAIQDLELVEKLGTEIGEQARCVGVNLVLGPVVDVNTNPKNPVIHLRSFGADKNRVAELGCAWMRGLQSTHSIACAKHFPGHGDTHQDSHDLLPTLLATREALAKVELFPFQQLINNGVGAVLTAHLSLPNVDPEPNRCSSLSPIVIQDLLRREMGFRGLILTDDLIMGAVEKLYGPGEAAKMAFLAGNHLILASGGVREGIEAIKEAVAKGEITQSQIDERVNQILIAKEKLFSEWEPQHDVWATIMNESAYRLCEQLYENAVTVVYGKELVPIRVDQKVEVHQFGPGWSPLTQVFDYHYKDGTFSTADPVISLLVVFPDAGSGKSGFLTSKPKTDAQYREVWDWIKEKSDTAKREGRKVLCVWFGSPYGLRGVPSLDALILGYEDVVEAGEAVAKVLLGQIDATGKLPIAPY